jgi:formylmethanofuran dehydrogenase subunit E
MTTDEKEIVTCEGCGCILEEGDLAYKTVNGGYVCESCKRDDYTYCEDCGELYSWDDINEADGKYICIDCLEHSGKYFRCDDCGEWHVRSIEHAWWTENNYSNVSGGGIVCNRCADDNYYICNNCGEAVRCGDEVTVDDEYYCEHCASDMRGRIHEYGYKPEPKFKNIHDAFFGRRDRDSLYFGVELEVDDGYSRNDCAVDLTKASEDIYCKTDGSLHRGIEIVTHPCTLDYHTEAMAWEDICTIARDYGFDSGDTSTCGLHIHVGLDELGETRKKREEVKAKLVMLVRRHWANLVVFSRRNEEELDEWADRPYFKYGEDAEESVANALRTVNRGRYQAVNLTNGSTVEFRLFKGTIYRDEIIAALQLVSNLCHYAMDHTVEEVMKSQWEDVALLTEYEELKSYLADFELLESVNLPEEHFVGSGIEVGDLVRVVAEMGSGNEWLHDMQGWVVYMENGILGVDFGVRLSEFSTLGGSLPGNTGYFFMKKELALVKKGEKEVCA